MTRHSPRNVGRSSSLLPSCRALSIAFAAIAVACANASVASQPCVNESTGNVPVGAVADLDRRAMESLGVGIIALGLLAEAAPQVLFLAIDLEKNGRMSAVRQLESAALVSVHAVESAQGRLIQLTPTTKGKEIARALNAELSQTRMTVN